jgi:hypothetical protein
MRKYMELLRIHNGGSSGGTQQSGQTSERRSLAPAHSVNTFVPGVGRHKYEIPDSEFAKLALPERDLTATTFAIKEGIAKERGLKLDPKKGSCRMVFPDKNGVNVQCLDQTHLTSERPHHKQLNAQTTQIADPETLQMLIDLELEKGSWEAVRAHTSAATVSGSAAPFDWDALVTVTALVILIGAGIQVFMPFLNSFGVMAPTETAVTSFKWVVVSTAIMPAVAVQQATTVAGDSTWLMLCMVFSAVILGTVAVISDVSHRYRNVARAVAKTALLEKFTPDTQAHPQYFSRLSEHFPCIGLGELFPLPVDDSDALDEYDIVPPNNSQVLPPGHSKFLDPERIEPNHDDGGRTTTVSFTRTVRPQRLIRHRPAGASVMFLLGLFFKGCGASTVTTPVVVASAHIDFLNMWFISMVWLTAEAAFFLCCTRGKPAMTRTLLVTGITQWLYAKASRAGKAVMVMSGLCSVVAASAIIVFGSTNMIRTIFWRVAGT